MKKEKRVIDACMDVAMGNTDHGCLFVIELEPQHGSYYAKVFPQLAHVGGRKLNVTDPVDKKIVQSLAAIDGATVVDKDGELREFGVTLKHQRTFLSHGKRHAFALGTSARKGIVCIVASEEDKHVRAFKGGICITDVDSRTGITADVRHKIIEILDTPMSKLLVGAGVAASILTLNPIPAIITITGSGVAVSYGFDRLKNLFQLRAHVQKEARKQMVLHKQRRARHRKAAREG